MYRITTIAAAACLMLASGCGPGTLEEQTAQSESLPDMAAPINVFTPMPDPTAEDWTASVFVKALPANPREGADGLEMHREWSSVSWANDADVKVFKRSETVDDFVLTVRIRKGQKDKAGVTRNLESALDPDGSLRVDVFNSADREIGVAFAVYAGIDDVYSESTTQPAVPGWNHLVWRLSEKTFKTEASNWENNTALWGPDKIRRVVILFYDPGTAALAIDNLSVDLAP